MLIAYLQCFGQNKSLRAACESWTQFWPRIIPDEPPFSWQISLFRRMVIIRRFAATGKVKTPDGVKKEAEFLYINNIVDLIETHNIPKSMVLNLDQTLLKYVPRGTATFTQKSSSTVPIKGVSDKRMITETFTISLDG